MGREREWEPVILDSSFCEQTLVEGRITSVLGRGREFQGRLGIFCGLGPALLFIPVCGLLLVTDAWWEQEVYKADDMEMHYNEGKRVSLSWLTVLVSAVLGWASIFEWSCYVLLSSSSVPVSALWKTVPGRLCLQRMITWLELQGCGEIGMLRAQSLTTPYLELVLTLNSHSLPISVSELLFCD